MSEHKIDLINNRKVVAAGDTSTTDVSLDAAEFIIFNSALTPADLVSLYNRSKARMARRNITI